MFTKNRIRILPSFRKYATEHKDRISPHDFASLMRDMGLQLEDRMLVKQLNDIVDDDGWIHFKRLSTYMPEFILEYGKSRRFSKVSPKKRSRSKKGSSFMAKNSLDRVFREIHFEDVDPVSSSSTTADDDGSKEDVNVENKEETKHDVRVPSEGKYKPIVEDEHMLGEGMDEDEQEDEDDEHAEYYITEDEDGEPRINSRKIIQDASLMMLKGSVLIFLFADPMVDALNDCGFRMNISPFYIAFIVAPLASNASEFLAAYKIAKKKTPSTITVSFSTLTGAAIMNNTFVLGIFMLLVLVRNLAWEFTAETFSILLVEFAMLYFTSKAKNTLFDGFLVLSLFPLSLLVVVLMTSVGGLD